MTDPSKCIVCGREADGIRKEPGAGRTVVNGKEVSGSLCAEHANSWGKDD